eukprot:g26626.t1
MRGVQANCPACAGPVEFKISSALVTVCEFCRTVVARGDRKLEDHGKVAAIVETSSPLHVGLRGKYKGKRFDIVGHVQFQHQAGGVWDEWYAAFPGGRWGWLAEAQGKMHLTFERKLSGGSPVPTLDELEVGRAFQLGKAGELKVAEIGTTRALGAEGELPFALQPDQEHSYADLAGADGAFGTFDYSTSPATVYLGKTVSLEDLGLADAVAAERDAKHISAIQVNCPNCGGALDLVAPDQTLRVCCPFCSSMLAADNGKLEYMKTLMQGKSHPVIPLGTVGTLDGVEYTVIGYVRRSVRFDIKYYWSEYLLYNQQAGFRWLIHSDAHWSFAEPLSIGDTALLGGQVVCDGRSYKLFQRAAATVEFVLGEFYWQVEIGETVYAQDFISPPHMITLERSIQQEPDGDVDDDELKRRAQEEVNITRATYLKHEDVEKAFGVENLAKGWKPAPNQPNPVDSGVFAWWGIFAVALFVLDLIFVSGIVKPAVDQGIFMWGIVMLSVIPVGALIYRISFESSRWKDSEHPTMNRAPSFLLYINVLVVATCGLIYELLAGTLASYVLGDSVTQFSFIIGTYLSALGVGAWLSRFVKEGVARCFIEVELGVALLGGVSAPLLFIGFAKLHFFQFVLYGVVFLIGTLVGLELPLLMRILKSHVDFDDLVSRVLAFDYIGAVVASLMFPILLVPHLGLIRTSLLFGMLNAGVGIWGSYILEPLLKGKLAGLRGRGVIVVGLLLAGFIKADALTTLAEENLFEHKIVYTKTSPYQRIVITKSDAGFRLFLNGHLQFHSADEYRYHEALVHPAMILAGSPRRVLVLGGGDGLGAGFNDFVLLELENQAGGTSRSGKTPIVSHPWGAHYLPTPMQQNAPLVRLLDEMNVLEGRDAEGQPIVAEQFLCRDPEQRVFFEGSWHEDLYPHQGATKADKAERARLKRLLDAWVAWRDSKGRRAFAVPIADSSDDAVVAELDRISMRTWMKRQGFRSKRLYWMVDFSCRDDYGLDIDHTSAWAGLFYFASRIRKPGMKPQPLISWPEGNGRIVQHMQSQVKSHVRLGMAVTEVAEIRDADSPRVDVVALDRATGKAVGWHAQAVVFTAPQFLAPYVVRGFAEDRSRAKATAGFEYGSWMVANLTLKDRPERNGFAQAWENVIYDSKSLGYISATHQRGIDYGPTVLTYYYPLIDPDQNVGRRKLLEHDWHDWADITLTDLETAHPDIRPLVERLDVMRWGHAMIRPRLGFVSSAERRDAAKPFGRVHFANTDLSGIALFEEAFYHGNRTADSLLADEMLQMRAQPA